MFLMENIKFCPEAQVITNETYIRQKTVIYKIIDFFSENIDFYLE